MFGVTYEENLDYFKSLVQPNGISLVIIHRETNKIIGGAIYLDLKEYFDKETNKYIGEK
jgi:hypothetical protein